MEMIQMQMFFCLILGVIFMGWMSTMVLRDLIKEIAYWIKK